MVFFTIMFFKSELATFQNYTQSKLKLIYFFPINSFSIAETFGSEEDSILQTALLWKANVSAYIGPQETWYFPTLYFLKSISYDMKSVVEIS